MIEAELAADLIVATEQSRDAFHWVYVYRANGEHRLAAQCRAQGISLQRETKRTLREIHRLQAETRKRHADHADTDTAERIEHITMVTTAEAIEQMPDPTPEPYVPQRPAAGRDTPGRPSQKPTRSPAKRRLRLHRDSRTVLKKVPPAAPCSTRRSSPPAARTGTAPCSSPTNGPPKRPNPRKTKAAAHAIDRTVGERRANVTHSGGRGGLTAPAAPYNPPRPSSRRGIGTLAAHPASVAPLPRTRPPSPAWSRLRHT